MKKFNVPEYYSSSIIENIRRIRDKHDPRKKDISPSILCVGKISIYIGRHFGFCYGVKNAIEICYNTLKQHPNKKIYLLSQMIHNQVVNEDLIENGISFIMDTQGNQLIPWHEVNNNDIVIIPAFGVSLEILNILQRKGINTEKFNTTCPFVSKVWNRSEKIANDGHTVIIYGAAYHEETKSTFSRAKKHGPAIIVENMKDVDFLCKIIKKESTNSSFEDFFHNKTSKNFNPARDLIKIGVVNQTTMLASDTKKIINKFTATLQEIYGETVTKNHIANTRDTLCYATNENQESTISLLNNKVDFSIIVGGYNSSNTTHLAELTSQTTPTYFINSADKISTQNIITYFDIKTKKEIKKYNFLPEKKCKIILTSGASCPDIILEKIIQKLIKMSKDKINENKLLSDFELQYKKS